MTHFDFPGYEKRIADIDGMMLQEGFYADRKQAQSLISERNNLNTLVTEYHRLQKVFTELSDTVDLLKEHFDDDMTALVEEEVVTAMADFDAFEIKL